MYHPILTHCPVCHDSLTVTQLRCESCDIKIDGSFLVSGLASLTPDQLDFVETFLRCEGKINRVEEELKISYPTVRNRLRDIIVSMGYEPAAEIEAEEAQREAQRLEVLEQLATGEISPDDAVSLLGRSS